MRVGVANNGKLLCSECAQMVDFLFSQGVILTLMFILTFCIFCVLENLCGRKHRAHCPGVSVGASLEQRNTTMLKAPGYRYYCFG